MAFINESLFENSVTFGKGVDRAIDFKTVCPGGLGKLSDVVEVRGLDAFPLRKSRRELTVKRNIAACSLDIQHDGSHPGLGYPLTIIFYGVQRMESFPVCGKVHPHQLFRLRFQAAVNIHVITAEWIQQPVYSHSALKSGQSRIFFYTGSISCHFPRDFQDFCQSFFLIPAIGDGYERGQKSGIRVLVRSGYAGE